MLRAFFIGATMDNFSDDVVCKAAGHSVSAQERFNKEAAHAASELSDIDRANLLNYYRYGFLLESVLEQARVSARYSRRLSNLIRVERGLPSQDLDSKVHSGSIERTAGENWAFWLEDSVGLTPLEAERIIATCNMFPVTRIPKDIRHMIRTNCLQIIATERPRGFLVEHREQAFSWYLAEIRKPREEVVTAGSYYEFTRVQYRAVRIYLQELANKLGIAQPRRRLGDEHLGTAVAVAGGKVIVVPDDPDSKVQVGSFLRLAHDAWELRGDSEDVAVAFRPTTARSSRKAS